MNCKKAVELLAGCLAGELEPGEKNELSGHLNSCEACRKELEQLEKSWQLLSAYEPPKLGDGFADSLMRKIRSLRVEDEKPVFSFNLFDLRLTSRTAAAFATLLLALAVPSLWKLHKGAESPAAVPAAETQAIPVSDKEIIADLEVYENSELLENMNLISDLDTVADSGTQKL